MNKFCLDTNALIEPWNKYYSMELCPDYWELLDSLAKEGTIFCTEEVERELSRTDDDLTDWVKIRSYLFKAINEDVQIKLRELLEKYPRLVDTIKDRSMADPWVIAHAMAEDAIVVTKEILTLGSKKRIRIPDVCEALGIPWMDDHGFAQTIGIRFSVNRI